LARDGSVLERGTERRLFRPCGFGG